ncbi:MAG: acyltransferase [Muribaculaceae bacterium]|nr:acyltransferase [Muribaculaceae bacterium]
MKFTLTKNTTNALKVFSALLVMVHHYVLFIMPPDVVISSWILRGLEGQAGVLGVAIFFFLSGYGLMESEKHTHLSFKEFTERRFFKVYLPVVLVTAIWMVVCEFVPGFTHPSDESVGRIVWGLLFSFNDAVMWFVRVLIGLYVIFYLFVLIYKRNPKGGLVFLVTATVGLIVVVVLHFGEFAAISVPLFPFGMVLSIYRDKRATVPVMLGFLVVLAVSYYYLYYLGLAVHASVNFLIIALIMVICSLRRIDIAVPAVLALLSYDVYLIHNKVIMVISGQPHLHHFRIYLLITAICTLLFFFLRTRLSCKKKSKSVV